VKKLAIAGIILSFYACQTSPQEFQWVEESFNDVLNRANNKLVLVEFYTDWCTWCKKLEAETFPEKSVIDIAHKYYISTKIDAEKDEGPELKEKYSVSGYPTTVIVDNNGNEVDRIVGYLPADQYVAELDRIRQGIETIPALQSRVAVEPEDIDAWKMLATKYEDNGSTKLAEEAWFQLATLDEEMMELAAFKSAVFAMASDGKTDKLKAFIDQNPTSQYLTKAYYTLVKFYKKHDDVNEEAQIYKLFSDLIVQSGKDNYNALNGYAWRMAELDLNLEDALNKIRLAVDMIDSKEMLAKAQVMDTEAEVLWKLGRTTDAVEVINKCIELQPDDEYYTNQKSKFQQSQ